MGADPKKPNITLGGPGSVLKRSLFHSDASSRFTRQEKTPSCSTRYRGLRTYCNRTAMGLIRAVTQWTKRLRRIIENRLNKRNFRTHQDGLDRAQAIS